MTFGYQAPPDNIWQGRRNEVQGEKLFHRVKCVDMSAASFLARSTFGFIGFACDEGVRRNQGRIGASAGPKAIRQALANISLQSEKPYFIDGGDIYCHLGGNLEASQQLVGQYISKLHSNHIVPIVLGGGHETAWGHFLGLAAHSQTKKIGIINIDAHFDLRPYESHNTNSGTPFLQIAHYLNDKGLTFDYTVIGIQPAANSKSLFKIAQELGVNYALAQDCFNSVNQINYLTQSSLERNELIYLSICLDSFSAAIAPGVSAPQPLGIFPHLIFEVLNKIASSKKLAGVDIVELAPNYDVDNRTAKLAAQLLAFIFDHYI